MKANIKRIFAFVLCLAMLVPLASCASKTPASNVNLNRNIRAEIKNLKGTSVKILYVGMGKTGADARDSDYEVIGEENSDQYISSKVFERNKITEKKLNCKLEFIPSGKELEELYNDTSCNPQTSDYKSLSIYDNEFEIALLPEKFINRYQSFNFKLLEMHGAIDVDNPWWYKDAIMEMRTSNDSTRFLYGDINFGDYGSTVGIFYNKDLYAKYVNKENPEALYEYVMNGKWTLEQFAIETSNSFVDLGDKDKNIYGFNVHPLAKVCNCFPVSSGIVNCKRNYNGVQIAVVFPDEKSPNRKAYNLADQIIDLVNNNKGVRKFVIKQLEESRTHHEDFLKDKVVFEFGNLRDYYKDIKMQTNSKIGFLPFPKYDDKQEEYLNLMGDKTTVTLIESSVTDERFNNVLSIILEFMGDRGKMINDGFYESASMRGGKIDEKEVEMLKLLKGEHPTVKSKLVKDLFYNFPSYAKDIYSDLIVFNVTLEEYMEEYKVRVLNGYATQHYTDGRNTAGRYVPKNRE